MNTRIVLADDHTIVRNGFRVLLEKQPSMEVVDEVGDGRSAVTAARERRPDVVVMDLSMPELNGIEATRQIRMESPQVKVVCLSMHSERRFVTAALEAGASGYLLKECAVEDLVEAIHRVISGQVYLSPAVAGTVVGAYMDKEPAASSSSFSVLTHREREVLQLLAEGHSTKEIAARLGLSVKTIGTHREHIAEKLDIHNVAGLTKYAIREGLTTVTS